METENSTKTGTATDANTVLAEGFNPHETIVVGWLDGKITYCRTFNHVTDRYNMMKAFDYVREHCDNYTMSSRLDKLIRYEG